MLNQNFQKVNNIFTAAHKMTRAALSESADHLSYSATFGAALKICWAAEKSGATKAARIESAEQSARAVFSDWAKMSDEKRIETVKASIWSAAARIGQYSGQEARDVLTGDIWDYIGATWEKIGALLDGTPEQIEKLTARNIERANDGKPALTLRALISRPAAAAIAVQLRETVKNASALRVVLDDDGEQRQVIDLLPAPNSASIDFMLDVADFLEKRDALDRSIWTERAAGLTMQQIGDAHGVTKMAVSKRLKVMREELRAAAII